MTHDKEERSRHLFDQYQFRCQCQACTNDWPIYASLELNELFIRYILVYIIMIFKVPLRILCIYHDKNNWV